MNSGGWTIFGAVLLAALLAIGGAYVVFQIYVPPVSATAPVTPEVRQVGLYLHSFEAGERKVHHWIPDVIVVNAGDTVILRVTNTDEEDSHGFGLGALNVAVPTIAPGETVTLRFVAARPGIYHYACTLAGCARDHPDQIGQFVVLPGR
ncbi:MAG: cupredoxin domain-containing protein [Armatimonadota bacterium]|nr:cupredoxin domain-containing protein [Armatimonadota bacterium]MDR7450571.1 cupredoxin domain-containing protein [Armatimonadota bacterium]MDR7466296.1 cupredoxin domain-containing protein [Armatimonadota bacterium]MDR7493017.1 cupredoxin domain-containing protein [Armatimonadota bacterium]MDR7498226.1 cupredoxin domain-containing protein [Armatimonadota bacterium]